MSNSLNVYSGLSNNKLWIPFSAALIVFELSKFKASVKASSVLLCLSISRLSSDFDTLIIFVIACPASSLI